MEAEKEKITRLAKASDKNYLNQINSKIYELSKLITHVDDLLIKIDDNTVYTAVEAYIKKQEKWVDIYIKLQTFNGTISALKKRIEREIKKI